MGRGPIVRAKPNSPRRCSSLPKNWNKYRYRPRAFRKKKPAGSATRTAAQRTAGLSEFRRLPVSTHVYELPVNNEVARAAASSDKKSAARRAGRSSTFPDTSSVCSMCARSMPALLRAGRRESADQGSGQSGDGDRKRPCGSGAAGLHRYQQVR